MDNKQSKIVKTAAELLMVYSAQCKVSGENEFSRKEEWQYAY